MASHRRQGVNKLHRKVLAHQMLGVVQRLCSDNPTQSPHAKLWRLQHARHLKLHAQVPIIKIK